MATSDKFLGTNVHVFVNGKKVANCKSDNYDVSKDMIEVSNKDSGGSKEYLAGEYGGKFSVEGFMEMDPTVANDLASFQDMHAYLLAGTKVDIRYTTGTTGDLAFETQAFFSNLKWDNANNDASTFSGDIQITGIITPVTES